jgi:hypothetical protein
VCVEKARIGALKEDDLMDKLNFKKQDKALYSGKVGRFDVLDVPAMPFLSIEGQGEPSGAVYAQAVAALYSVSYNLKFFSKQQLGRDYGVAPLEGLWWADDMNTFITREKSAWKWRMMIRQPDWFTGLQVSDARAAVIEKQGKMKEPKAERESLEKLRFGAYDEGLSVQVLHVGSYDEEGPVLEQMHHSFIPENGYKMTGLHHEIYIGDPRRVAPEKLKTILRQPVAKV